MNEDPEAELFYARTAIRLFRPDLTGEEYKCKTIFVCRKIDVKDCAKITLSTLGLGLPTLNVEC